MGLVSELRRRNVLRMAVLYAVAAWLIMQVVEVMMSLVGLPAWAGRATFAVLAVGFPISLIFSWFYEITPGSISLEKDVDPEQSITRVTGRRLDFIVISLLVAAVILFAYDKWWIGGPPEKSIAVLPFINMSDDPEQKYFSDGISEELLNVLAKIPGLRVVARSSSFQFKGENRDIIHIGQQLNVAHVLEGSVRKAGSQLRITAQLIDTEDGYHMWSETYDRELTDIFAIQDDIAAHVVDKLKATLLGEDIVQLSEGGTSDLEAYTAYLLGKQRIAQRTIAALNEAREYFMDAIRRDPDYAQAYVGLAGSYMLLQLFGDLSVEDMLAGARPALDKALALNDELAEAHAALGSLAQMGGDRRAAEVAYRRALELNQNCVLAYHLYGNLLSFRAGRLDEGERLLHRALELDPLSIPINLNVAQVLELLGRFDEALVRLFKALEIRPGDPLTHGLIGQIYMLGFGRLDEGVRWARMAMDLDPASPLYPGLMSDGYMLLGDDSAAELWARHSLALAPDNRTPHEALALLYYFRNQEAEARQYAERVLAVDPREQRALFILRNLDIAKAKYSDARTRYETVFPKLRKDNEITIDRSNLNASVDLAYVLMQIGEQRRAKRMLDKALSIINTMPRKGIRGFAFSDVKVYALQGRKLEALDALRRAVDDGWRGGQEAWWMLERDPNLSVLHDDPRFKDLIAEMTAELTQMRQSLQREP